MESEEKYNLTEIFENAHLLVINAWYCIALQLINNEFKIEIDTPRKADCDLSQSNCVS